MKSNKIYKILCIISAIIVIWVFSLTKCNAQLPDGIYFQNGKKFIKIGE